MKKVVLIFILMLGVLNAKQFAYCANTLAGGAGEIKFCGSDGTSIENIYRVSDMYRKGWRLITVNTVYLKFSSSYQTYFYFEK